MCCLPSLVTLYQVFVRLLFELSSTCLFGLVLSLSCTMPVFNSGPAFFKQLSLPPSVALSASWASQAPRNAAVASKGLASQLGASSLHPASGGGEGSSVVALCIGGLPFFCRPLYWFGEGGSRCLVDRCSCAPRTGQTVGSFRHGLGSPRGSLARRWRHTSPRPRSRVHCWP